MSLFKSRCFVYLGVLRLKLHAFRCMRANIILTNT